MLGRDPDDSIDAPLVAPRRTFNAGAGRGLPRGECGRNGAAPVPKHAPKSLESLFSMGNGTVWYLRLRRKSTSEESGEPVRQAAGRELGDSTVVARGGFSSTPSDSSFCKGLMNSAGKGILGLDSCSAPLKLLWGARDWKRVAVGGGAGSRETSELQSTSESSSIAGAQ